MCQTPFYAGVGRKPFRKEANHMKIPMNKKYRRGLVMDPVLTKLYKKLATPKALPRADYRHEDTVTTKILLG